VPSAKVADANGTFSTTAEAAGAAEGTLWGEAKCALKSAMGATPRPALSSSKRRTFTVEEEEEEEEEEEDEQSDEEEDASRGCAHA
jgi:hypothetical protein